MHKSLTPHRGWRRRASASALAGVAALTAGGLALAPSAGAAARAAGVAPLLEPAMGASPSTYLGGYQDVPSGGLASASATFTIPKIACTKAQETNGAGSFVGVYTDTVDVYAFIALGCTSTGPVYEFEFSTPAGGFIEPNAHPGDVVVTSLFESGTSSVAQIRDLTAGASWGSGTPGNLGDTKIDFGTYNEVQFGSPVPNFDKVAFSNVTVDGYYLGFDTPTKFNALNGGDTLVKTGALNTTAAGSTFTATFKHSS